MGRRTRCRRCERGLRRGEARCPCGATVGEMTFEERTRHEVEQWKTHLASTRAGW